MCHEYKGLQPHSLLETYRFVQKEQARDGYHRSLPQPLSRTNLDVYDAASSVQHICNRATLVHFCVYSERRVVCIKEMDRTTTEYQKESHIVSMQETRRCIQERFRM